MRNRINRTKSSIPQHHIKQQTHFVLWLNAERRQFNNKYEKSSETLSENKIGQFQQLQQFWSSGFLRKLLKTISDQFFNQKYSSIQCLDIQQNTSQKSLESNNSFYDNQKYQKIIENIQRYLKYEFGQQLSPIFPMNFINIFKLVSLILYLCVSSASKKNSTAMIILSLPMKTKQFLHNEINTIKNQWVQPIQEYRQILKAMIQFQEENSVLIITIKELQEKLYDCKSLIAIKDEEIDQLRLYCQKMESSCQELYDSLQVGSLDDVKQYFNQIMHNYKEESQLAVKLADQNMLLEKEITKISVDISDREKVIVELNEQLERYKSQRSMYSNIYQNFGATDRNLNCTLLGKSLSKQSSYQIKMYESKLGHSFCHKNSELSTNLSSTLNKPRNIFHQTSSSFNSNIKQNMSKILQEQSAQKAQKFANSHIKIQLGCQSFLRDDQSSRNKKQYKFGASYSNCGYSGFFQGSKMGGTVTSQTSQYVGNNQARLEQIQHLKYHNLQLSDRIMELQTQQYHISHKLKRITKAFYWLCDQLGLNRQQLYSQQSHSGQKSSQIYNNTNGFDAKISINYKQHLQCSIKLQ